MVLCNMPSLNQKFYITLISSWVTLFIFSLVLAVVDEGHKFGIIVVLLLISIPKLKQIIGKLKTREIQKSKILNTKLGYVVLGISASLFITASLFNFFYSYEGWFDFRDIGFFFFSFPLSAFMHFEVNRDVMTSRLILYFITLINLVLVTIITDLFGFFINKIIHISDIKKSPIE